MFDEEIEYMRQCLQSGVSVFYRGNDGLIPIKSIGTAKEGDDEREPVAFRADGNYYSLWASCKDDYVLMVPYQTNWPEVG